MLLNWYYRLIMVGILLELRLDMRGTSASTQPPCGSYGFRCLDSKTFQICLIDEGDAESPADIHECREGLVCDEENQAYCTPVDSTTVTQNVTCSQERYARESNRMYEDILDAIDESKILDYIENYNDGTFISSTGITQEETPGTTEGYKSSSFDCEGYGFFPDSSNHSLFWFCDVPANGEGYYVRHMICGKDRIFDVNHRACVLDGTVRNYRMNNNEKNTLESGSINTLLSPAFTCHGKVSGRYSDGENCRVYHYCLQTTFAPVEELTLLCPLETAYDPDMNKCSSSATYRCITRRQVGHNSNQFRSDRSYDDLGEHETEGSPVRMERKLPSERKHNWSNVNCRTPIRFRELNYCYGFFLCVGNEVMEMECPEYYKFDDNLLKCVHENIAVCQ